MCYNIHNVFSHSGDCSSLTQGPFVEKSEIPSCLWIYIGGTFIARAEHGLKEMLQPVLQHQQSSSKMCESLMTEVEEDKDTGC